MIAIDKYLANFYGFRGDEDGTGWRSGIVLGTGDFEEGEEKFFREKCPLLVQYFSNYLCYQGKQVYATDNIYTTIAAWFYFVKKPPYYNRPFGFDLTECSQKILKLQ